MRKLFWREQILERDIETLKRQLREKLGGYRVAINYVKTENLLFRGVVCDERPAGPIAIDLPEGPRCSRAAGTVYPAMQMRGVSA